MRTGWLKLAAIPIASVFLAAACGSDNSSSGGATATTARDHRCAGDHRGGDDHHDGRQYHDSGQYHDDSSGHGRDDDAPPDAGQRQRREGDGVRRRGLGERGRCHAGRPDRVRQGQRDRHHLRRSA